MKAMLITLLVGVVLFFAGRMGLARKPSENSLVNARAKEPVQTAIAAGTPEAQSLSLDFDSQHYTLYPKARYKIEGLIVSQHRSNSAFDLAHARTGDTLNSRDICTVWGPMLAGGVYRDVKFWSGDWTCYYQYSDPVTASLFKADQISNTHVLAKDPEVRAKLASLEVGDEYRMTGQLVDYELAGVGRRNTSLVRTDTENGACEVMYVESVEILKSHNKTFGFLYELGRWTMLASIVGIIALMLRSIFFRRSSLAALALIFATQAFVALVSPEEAHAKICDSSTEYCGDGMGSSSSSSTSGAGTRSSRIRSNPALIPIARGIGLETIFFDGADFGLVTGLGRVGAAISPSNSEETFFGPPGIEAPQDLLERKRSHHKFPSQKYSLGTAFGLYNNNKTGYSRVGVNLGVMGKYNKISGEFSPGAGLSGMIGPVSLSYSRYADQTAQKVQTSPTQEDTQVSRYNVETMSIGAYLGPVILDYSLLNILDYDDSSVNVFTGTVILGRALVTAAIRNENINRQSYNYSTDSLELVDSKTEYFIGAQYAVVEWALVGAFYNYYLMNDVSLGLTVFF